MVWLGIKKCVNYFKLRHDICICIFVCMTKYNQISCNLNEIPLVLVKGAMVWRSLYKSLFYLEGLSALYLESLTLAKKSLCKFSSPEVLSDSNI